MMKFKGIASPSPAKGVPGGRVSEFVPDQSLSLREILNRFVRKEALPVGHNAVFGSQGEIDPESDSPFNVDQEKAKHWDLAEKQEFREAVMEAREKYNKEERVKASEKAKLEKEAQKAAFDKKVRLAAKKYIKEFPGGVGKPSI